MSKVIISDEQSRKNISRFISEAWCVNGSVDLGVESKVIMKDGTLLDSLTFEIDDSRRGKFYISLSVNTPPEIQK